MSSYARQHPLQGQFCQAKPLNELVYTDASLANVSVVQGGVFCESHETHGMSAIDRNQALI